MALTPGARLGPYEVLSLIGAGGMGSVYKARDTRLGRDVAIKVSAEAFSERFEREARAISALNHPNICTLHDVGPDFLVMELVDGPTLADLIAGSRLKAQGLELDDVLTIARQIADALEVAHEHGIVHRDLKPANIKVASNGNVKVLDFGLAKMSAAPVENPENSPTFTASTRVGTLLGTAAYMSPEQARGMAVDKRTDIWAFGVVLYEMLTGKQLFQGDSITDILAAVVRSEPDFGALPASTPPSIRRLLTRCLEKDRRKRLPDIGVARLEIDDAKTGEAPEPARPAQRSTLVPWLVAASALVAVGIVSWFGFRASPRTEWTATRLNGADIAIGPRVSPDGQLIAFMAMVDGLTQVAVMKPETGNWTVLTRERSRGPVINICWSRDSARVYFDRLLDAPAGIFSVPVLGGDEQLIIENALSPEILPDGSFLVQQFNAERRYQLHRVWPETGRAQALKIAVPWTNGGVPFRATPAGDRVAVVGSPMDVPGASLGLYVMDLASEQIRPLARVALTETSGVVAVTPDGQSALAIATTDDLFRVVRVPLDGSASVETMLMLPERIEYLDVGRDGAIYVDQRERPVEVYRGSVDGRTRDRLAETTLSAGGTAGLPLPDGRVLVTSRSGGRNRLLLVAKDKEATPFLEIQEPTGRPMALVGTTHVAITIGEDSARTLAIASIANRRVTRRLEGSKGMDLESVVASTDGKTLYYAAAGSIYSIPVEDGQPQRLRKGDSVTIDPNRQELIIRLTDVDGTRLVRQPIAGGPEKPIALEGNIQVAPWYIWSSAVGKDSSLLVSLTVPDSWFWHIGLLNPDTGRLRVLDLAPKDADMGAGWTNDGELIVNAMRLRSSMWRFVPRTVAR